MKSEIKNSYLSYHVMIFHSAIIGFSAGVLDMLYGFYTVYISGIEQEKEILFWVLILQSLGSLIGLVILSVISAIIAYPIYKKWALSKGGITIVVNTVNNEQKT